MTRLRPHTPADTDRIVDIWYRASKVAHGFLREDFFEQERREIVDAWLPGSDTTVVEHDGLVVGFISLVGNEVGGLFVDPELHGKGFGRMLMDDAVRRFDHVELDVFEKNEVGRRFYERYGFTPVGSHRHESTGEIELRLRFGRSEGQPCP